MSVASAYRRLAAGLLSFVVLSLVSCGGSEAPPAGTDAVPASITLTASAGSVGPGQTISVTAVVKDAQGNVLTGQTLSWLSSDTAVATVAGGVVTGVARGSASITASVGGVTSNAIVLSIVAIAPPGTASSDELIDAALAAGEIDAETALTYKVFAYFRDSRLPAKYTGSDDGFDEGAAIRQLDETFDSLSAQAQDVLAPFLMRPSDKGSWLDPAVVAAVAGGRGEAAHSRQKPLGRPVCNGIQQGWAVVDAPTAPVRVWYDVEYVNDFTKARLVAGYIENDVWPKMIGALQFNRPLEDATGSCDGGDSRLDIYIIGNIADRGLTKRARVGLAPNDGPVYILIRADLTGDELKHSVSHEFAHAIQWAYYSLAPQFSTTNLWFRDAFANWGTAQVYPGNTSLIAQASCHLKSTDLQQTDEATGFCTEHSNRSRNYGGYLLLEYISKTHGTGVVKDILLKMHDVSRAVEAINSATHSPGGGFKGVWPKYARKLWNQEPVLTNDAPNTYNDPSWGQLSNAAVHVPVLAPDQPNQRQKADAKVNGLTDRTTPLARRLDNLSIRYYHFDFTGNEEEKTRSVLFHNTFYNNWKNNQAVSVQAFYKVAGRWEEDDWTDSEWIGFCRDVKAQRIEELVIVLASGEWSGSNPVVEADEFPELKRNVIGCWGFKGLATRTETLRSGSMGRIWASFNARFQTPANAPAGQYTDASTGRKRVFNVAPLFVDGSWGLVENYSQGSCNYSASGGGTDTPTISGGKSTASLVINNFNEALPTNLRAPKEQLTGTAPGAYVAVGATLITVTGRVSGTDCEADPPSYDTIVGPWMVTRETAPRSVIGADGRIKDTYPLPDQAPGDSIVYEWDLEPLRE